MMKAIGGGPSVLIQTGVPVAGGLPSFHPCTCYSVKQKGMVPLEGDGKSVTQFLLVPHFGACIHARSASFEPNCVGVHGRSCKAQQTLRDRMATGRMDTERVRNDIASVGYVLEGRTFLARRVEGCRAPRGDTMCVTDYREISLLMSAFNGA